jgi:flagellar assembly factor FliW
MENTSTAETAQTEEKILIHFPNGIYGFEDVKEFILLQEDDNRVVWSLQAADQSYPSIIVVDPSLVMPGYAPKLTAEDRGVLGNPETEDLCWLAVAVIRKKLEDSVVSLKSPIVINVKNRLGMQVILDDDKYPLRCRPFAKNRGR